MPPIGLILGGLLALGPGNTKSKHWPWIIAASIVGALVWWVIISTGALTATNQSY